jgi:hypothetical protein
MYSLSSRRQIPKNDDEVRIAHCMLFDRRWEPDPSDEANLRSLGDCASAEWSCIPGFWDLAYHQETLERSNTGLIGESRFRDAGLS